MPVFLYEIEDGEDIHGFAIIADDAGTAERLEKLLGKAVLIGECVEPETLAYEVAKMRLN